MKKLLLTILMIVMAISLIACGDSDNGGTGGGTPGITPGGDGGNQQEYDPYDPEQYIYKNVFANSPYKDQWTTGKSGADLMNIWDNSILPNIIPEKPASVTEVDYTSYTGVLDQKYSSGSFGKFYFEEGQTDFEFYTLIFDGTEETYNELLEHFSKIFICYNDSEDHHYSQKRGYLHCYSKDWYAYLHYTEDGEYDWETNVFTPSGMWRFSLNITPAYFKLPTKFQGISLPQYGMLTCTYNIIACYNDGDDEYTYVEYDFMTEKYKEPVKEYWYTGELEYYGVEKEDVEKYCNQLLIEGLVCEFQSVNEYGEYQKRFDKNNVKVRVVYYESQKQLVVSIAYGEYWFY